LPIDPKPIITIGPVMRPWRGQWVMASDLLQGQATPGVFEGVKAMGPRARQ
jgi:hypothetical protein